MMQGRLVKAVIGPKQAQTQSNTIGSMEADWNVPESQRTPILYDTISEAKSLDNARLRLAQDYAGEMVELRCARHTLLLHYYFPKSALRF